MISTSDFPIETSGKTSVNIDLEPLNSPSEGTFTLRYGLFILGDDMNPTNNLKSISIFFDNSLDISISNPQPSINSDEGIWYAGENAVIVEVENKGNLSVENYVLTLEQIYEGQFTDIQQSCENINLHPGQKVNCYFGTEGLSRPFVHNAPKANT